jgi:hypothetical protein
MEFLSTAVFVQAWKRPPNTPRTEAPMHASHGGDRPAVANPDADALLRMRLATADATSSPKAGRWGSRSRANRAQAVARRSPWLFDSREDAVRSHEQAVRVFREKTGVAPPRVVAGQAQVVVAAD